MCPNTHLQLRGQFARVGSLPPLCGFQVSTSDCQSWQQAAYLLSHPSSQPLPSHKDISLTWLGLYHCDGISQCDGVNYSQKNPSANTVTVEARASSYELKVDDTAQSKNILKCSSKLPLSQGNLKSPCSAGIEQRKKQCYLQRPLAPSHFTECLQPENFQV